MEDQQDSENAGSQNELRQDKLVDRLAPDPSQPPQALTILSGFLSRSQNEGQYRLYLTPTFDAYVELAEEDIVYSKSLPESASVLGGTLLWIRSGASLQYTRTIFRKIQAEFLTGAITASSAASASALRAAVGLAGYAVRATHNKNCLSDACESDVAHYCPTVECTRFCWVGGNPNPLTGVLCVSDPSSCYGSYGPVCDISYAMPCHQP